MEEPHALLIFDGVCNLCNSSVNFTIRRDVHDYFRFAPYQSDAAQKILREHGFHSAQPESMILVEKGKLFLRSTAALRVVRKLRGAWPLCYVFIIVPPFIRNFFYGVIARNRYRWWGKRETCMVPGPELRKKFL